MSEIGPGTRVWIGWTPPERTSGKGYYAICRQGTVMGYVWWNPVNGCKEWGVDVEGVGYIEAAEHLLYPIDGGEPVTQTDEHEVVA